MGYPIIIKKFLDENTMEKLAIHIKPPYYSKVDLDKRGRNSQINWPNVVFTHQIASMGLVPITYLTLLLFCLEGW